MAHGDGDFAADSKERASANGLNTAKVGDGVDEQDEGQKTKRVVHGHPLLMNWTPPRSHKFSPAQIETLAAICDTVVPSLPPPFKDGEKFDFIQGVSAEDIKAFYKLKASDEDIIDVIAAVLEIVMRPVVRDQLLFALQLLGTGWGTFLFGSISGVNMFNLKYPFFRKFSSLSNRQQERVLQGWASSRFKQLRLMFKTFKAITGWAFYSKLDEQGQNPAWKAIGYCGPDPVVTNRVRSFESDKEQRRPLGDRHIDAKQAGDGLKSILASAGFTVVTDADSLNMQLVKAGYPKNVNDIYVECDVVVVGSGSGGGVVAAALAKQGLKVVVLEKGRYFSAQDITTLEGPGMINLYEKMGALATDDGGVALIAGTAVGGGTTVNWSVCFKTPDNVRNEWVKNHGLDLFCSDRYDQAMQAVWERLSVQPEVDKHSPQNSVLQEGCRKLGYFHGTLQRNCSPDHYCGWCSYGCPTGKKQSTVETWLVDAVSTGNTAILSNCTAERLVHVPNPGGKKGRKLQGIVALVGEGPNRIFIKTRATVVSCGALMTPPLLLSSGLTNPNIGKYLRLHPASTCFGYFPEGTGPEGKCYEGGIMTVYSPVTSRKSTEYGGLLETGVLHPAVFAAFNPWRSGADGKERLLHHKRTSHITVVTRDKGFGTVKLDKDGYPIYKYDISAYDEKSLVDGIVQALRVLIAAGAVEIGTHQLDGERFNVVGASTSDIEAYLARVRRRGAKVASLQLASAHQLGSCRMGSSPVFSAVDPRGETWEVEGLFVGDGSVLPTSSGVNPMVTIQSIAYCTADSVLQSLRKNQVQ